MKIGEWTLKRVGCTFEYRNDVSICLNGLRALFELPENATLITLELHTRKSKNRVPAPVLLDDVFNFPYFDFPQDVFDHPRLDKILKPYIDKTLYLACYHETD